MHHPAHPHYVKYEENVEHLIPCSLSDYEAAKRGLPNVKTTPQALDAYTSDVAKKLFEIVHPFTTILSLVFVAVPKAKIPFAGKLLPASLMSQFSIRILSFPVVPVVVEICTTPLLRFVLLPSMIQLLSVSLVASFRNWNTTM